MKKLEKIKQERIIKKQTKEYIESLNPKSKKQKFMEFMNLKRMNLAFNILWTTEVSCKWMMKLKI